MRAGDHADDDGMVGPILKEFYGASDVGRLPMIRGPEWLTQLGSVGRPILGVVDIRGSDGTPLPAGSIGEIWMGSEDNIGNTGDVGYLDDDGYLYHLDRKSNIVLVDGVDDYPEQIELNLLAHPAIADVAVIDSSTAQRVRP